jgi:hypothetical protein
VVLLQVLSEVLDAIGEECNLALNRACVSGVLAVLAENLSLLFFVEIHCFDELIVNVIHPSEALSAFITRGNFVKCGCKGTTFFQYSKVFRGNLVPLHPISKDYIACKTLETSQSLRT